MDRKPTELNNGVHIRWAKRTQGQCEVCGLGNGWVTAPFTEMERSGVCDESGEGITQLFGHVNFEQPITGAKKIRLVGA